MKTNVIFLKTLLAIIFLWCIGAPIYAAELLSHHYISCVSEESTSKARLAEYHGNQKATRARSWFANWLFGANKNTLQSKVDFIWKPITDRGPKVEIITTEKPHNSIRVISRTKGSVIFVSSASSPMTQESWTFALNFNLESMIATRVQSNRSGVRGEVLTYQCEFEDLSPSVESSSIAPIG